MNFWAVYYFASYPIKGSFLGQFGAFGMRFSSVIGLVGHGCVLGVRDWCG